MDPSGGRRDRIPAPVTAGALLPPFPYFGGKIRLAERIVDLLPRHAHYVEPFAGSLAVLLAKPRATMETVNDLDGDLVAFWRVLREQPDELALTMALTPHSREEHELSREIPEGTSDLERARRVWVRLSQGRGGTQRRTGWRFYRQPAGSSIGMPGYLAGYVNRVHPAAERLAGVSLENRDALEVIADYGQHADVLLYCDPPYLGTTRASRQYLHELSSDEEHRQFLRAVQDLPATVVISGYASDLYELWLDGWDRAELSAWTGNGLRDGRGKEDGHRTEVLWCNRPLVRDVPLF